MSVESSVDQQKVGVFVGKVVSDMAGLMATCLGTIGDRLGLFKDLTTRGPATSQELAQRTNIHERYAREWLRGMTSAGYLEFDPASGRYALPREHAPVLADEAGPAFFGGAFEQIPAMWEPLDKLIQAFRDGGGLQPSAYGQHFWDGMQRFTDTWFENLLLQTWIPAVPDLKAKLERGASVADVGCGKGKAIIKLSRAFPKSRFVGFDLYEPVIREARRSDQAAGMQDRVSFSHLDVARGMPGRYDLVTSFDTIHDMADPLAALTAIRQALDPDGTYLMLEWSCPENPGDNVGAMATFMYGYSIMYCVPASLADGGLGLGNLGFPESKVRELCTAAGFSSIRKLPIESPLNSLYEIKP